MPKLPDLGKLTEKFDLQGLMDNVKSILSPGSAIPENIEGDPIAGKLALIYQSTKKIAELQAEQDAEIAKINALTGLIMKDLAQAKMGETATENLNKTDDESLKK